MSTTQEAATQWQEIQEQTEQIRNETARVIVGQQEIVDLLMTSLLCKGHCLLVGVPGLAKTLLVSTLGKILGLDFKRIQFTPDLMPSDIIGTEILQTNDDGSRSFNFAPGPIFTNLLLADEINRTPPKTQAALLEAMQERQVSLNSVTHELKEPFTVFATQNPIEHEGTYPLPEAQLDRFFFKLDIGYPTIEEEEIILSRTTGRKMPEPSTVLDAARMLKLQDATHEVPLPEPVTKAILKLVHATRPDSEFATAEVKNYISYGAGPRASQTLVRAVKALALLRGQSSASIEELKILAVPTLSHRVVANYNATGEGITAEQLVAELAENIL